MNINSVEQSLAKYHLLHFIIGAIVAAILLAIPKTFGVLVAVFLAAMFLPSMILPEFTESKWLDRLAVLAGGIAIGLLFHFLGTL
ncbi:MAG: hypothetical protein LAN84_00185 [Acidobacteriia bacterium]|nr:hypothetical protein [Terriglobia bacterium]